MFDDLISYYHESVVASFISFREIHKEHVSGGSRDLRESLDAATALFHFREHFPGANKLSRTEVEQLCIDYGLLGDVVNSAKHRILTGGTPHGAPLVNDASMIKEIMVIIEYSDDIGTYTHMVKTINLTLTDGSQRDLLEVLTNVINFWEQHLVSLGLLSEARTFEFKNPMRKRSRTECEENQVIFSQTQGHRFSKVFQMLRFNNETGRVEPIPELQGATAEARIYKPKHAVDICLSNNDTGEEYRKSIELTDAESQELLGKKEEKEKQEFINSLECIKDGYRELAIEAGLVEVE